MNRNEALRERYIILPSNNERKRPVLTKGEGGELILVVAY